MVVLSLLTWRKQVLECEPASNFKQRVWTWQTAFMRKCCVSKRRRRKKRRCLHRTALCVSRLHGNCRRHVSSCLAVWRGQVLWHNWKLLLKNYRDLYIKRLYRFCHSEADKIMETPAAWYDTFNSISTCSLQSDHTAGSTSIWNSFSKKLNIKTFMKTEYTARQH